MSTATAPEQDIQALQDEETTEGSLDDLGAIADVPSNATVTPPPATESVLVESIAIKATDVPDLELSRTVILDALHHYDEILEKAQKKYVQAIGSPSEEIATRRLVIRGGRDFEGRNWGYGILRFAERHQETMARVSAEKAKGNTLVDGAQLDIEQEAAAAATEEAVDLQALFEDLEYNGFEIREDIIRAWARPQQLAADAWLTQYIESIRTDQETPAVPDFIQVAVAATADAAAITAEPTDTRPSTEPDLDDEEEHELTFGRPTLSLDEALAGIVADGALKVKRQTTSRILKAVRWDREAAIKALAEAKRIYAMDTEIDATEFHAYHCAIYQDGALLWFQAKAEG